MLFFPNSVVTRGQLVELQDFLEAWKRASFEEASKWINERYATSANLPLALKVIERFVNESDIENGSSEYLSSAFEEYLYEIEFDEFESTKAKVIVSTMHKAKGKEFDSVYVMVENKFIHDDYQRRLLYVALTRAKENLYIHTQDRCFQTFEPLANDVLMVNHIHEEPNSIVFTMGLGDLSLTSEAAAKGIRLANPIAGETVAIEKQVNEDGTIWFKLTKDGRMIGVLSKADSDKNRLSSKILQKESEGYTLDSEATIEYIVRWKEPMGDHRYDQILCKICMTK